MMLNRSDVLINTHRPLVALVNLRPVKCTRPSEGWSLTASDDALRGRGSGHTRLIHALTVFYYVCYRREMKMDL